jgi:uncharacterized protein
VTDQSSEARTAWGHLSARYQTSRPRRILALDGGGIRGVITLEVLRKLEDLLRARYARGSDFRLSEFFDYIGGTSTGAIIAASLARGMSVDAVQRFYLDFGTEIFRKRPWFERLSSLYDNGPLERKLREVYGEKTTLEPPGLDTLLLVVTRNATTDSAWPITSNPAAKYNALARRDCNLRIPLWQLVRASTAAPVFFRPEVVRWDPTDPAKSFVFVDGGTTSYNCPAFLMVRMATEPAYRLGWARGERQLLVVSIGTGSAPVFGNEADFPDGSLIANVQQTLKALMSQGQVDQDVNCRTIGRCTHGGPLDRELGDLIPVDAQGCPIALDVDLGRAFLYARYDAELTFTGLARLKLDRVVDAARVAPLDAVEAMDDLSCVGKGLAAQVDLEHFGALADPALAPLVASKRQQTI